MNNEQQSLTEMATRAMANAVANVIEQHRREGRPMAVWRDGKAVWIPAAETPAVREDEGSSYRGRPPEKA